MRETAAWTLALCDRIAAETDVAGTTTRLFLSPATVRVHALLRWEMEALGLAVSTDCVGNLRGLRPGPRQDAPVLLVGSHIDTVPNAGRYDGVLGVAAALGLLRLLGGRPLPFAVEVVAFSEEEGVRFRLPFFGSRALLGTLDVEELARTDAAGVSVAEALRAFPGLPAWRAEPLLRQGTFAFAELHIEQGPVLESLGLPLGVVETVVGQTRLELTFGGESNHAGTTPMPLRHDALAAAAEWIFAVEREAQVTEGLVATVGTITVEPGAPNVVPGRASCSLDVRHASDAVRVARVEKLVQAARLAAAKRGCSMVARETSSVASVQMSPALVQALLAASAGAGSSEAGLFQEGLPEVSRAAHRMNSGAGHDAMVMASAVPSAMLFVRTPGGLSHHPDEAVLPGDVEAALGTLLHFVLALRPPGQSAI